VAKLLEAGTDYWVPVQEALVRDMETELTPDDETEVFLIYIGQIGSHHVLLVNAFQHEGKHLKDAY
jgi:hypothetical protein